MRYRKCTVATLLILGCSCGRLISGRTPSLVGSGGGRPQSKQRQPVEHVNLDHSKAFGERETHSRGTAGAGQPKGDALCPRPSRIYGILAKHCVGRYVLATSSLVGECARVYAPAPLGLIALCLCGQVGIAFDSNGRNHGDSRGGRGSPPGVSYEQFLSEHHSKEDEELSSEVVVPPEKYGRVSLAFQTRHAIGRAENSQLDVSDEGATLVPTWPTPVFEDSRDDCVHFPPESISSVRIAGRSLQSESRFFKSLVGLRKDKSRGAGDDLDLLSDVDEGDVSNVMMGAKSARGKGVLLAREHDVSQEITRLSRSESDSTPASGPDPRYGRGSAHVVHTGPGSNANARNLVNGADDDASALISKLRQGASKTLSRAPKCERTRRTPRRARLSNEARDKT